MSTIDLAASPSDLRALAEQSNAWPFEQAKAIVARLKKNPKDEVLFETGYGPSGLPHIGTFGEVARTTMVRHAFRVLTEDGQDAAARFSDDMDGLRKVPDNVPNKEMLAPHLGKPLTSVPDPFGNDIRASARTTMRGCAPSSTPSASTTSSPARPILQVGPVRRDAAADAGALRRGDGDHAADAARGARGDLFAVPADLARAPAWCCTCRSSSTTPRPAPIVLRRSRERRARRDCRSPAGIASCSGSRTGRCAGSRSASTTKCPARI